MCRQWSFSASFRTATSESLTLARSLIADVEMAILPWREWGKGFIKRCKLSPDAFLQMTLQLAFRKVTFTKPRVYCAQNQNRCCLTYEAAMTRLYREGRTETVRSCSSASKTFVDAMRDPHSNVSRVLRHAHYTPHSSTRDARSSMRRPCNIRRSTKTR